MKGTGRSACATDRAMAILAMQERGRDARRAAFAMALPAILEHGQDARGTEYATAIPIENIGTGLGHAGVRPADRRVRQSPGRF